MDAFSGLRMHDRNSDLAQKTERYEALLATGEAVVLVRCRETFEYALGVSKVKTVISKIRPSLSLIPRKAHLRSVYTPVAFVNNQPAAL